MNPLSQTHYESELSALRSHHAERSNGSEPVLNKLAALELARNFPPSQLNTILFLSQKHGKAMRQLARKKVAA